MFSEVNFGFSGKVTIAFLPVSSKIIQCKVQIPFLFYLIILKSPAKH